MEERGMEGRKKHATGMWWGWPHILKGLVPILPGPSMLNKPYTATTQGSLGGATHWKK